MHTNHGPKEDPLTDLGYEPRDVNVGQLGKWVIGFFLFVVASLIASWVIIATGLHIGPIQIDAMSKAYAGKGDDFKSRKVPGSPNPILQNNVTAKTDIMDMRRAEEDRLKGYGWANAEKTKVTMPVDRAIDAMVSKGLPKTGAEVPAVSRGNDSDQRKDVVPGVTTEIPVAAPAKP